MYTDNDLYWLWLSLICSAGSTAGDNLIETFGFNSEAIYHADKNDYAELSLKPEIISGLLNKELLQVHDIISHCKKNGIGILTLASPMYPSRLKEIRTRPLVLYYKGNFPQPDIESNLCIAAVGTRRMTEYGKRTAYTISYDLARCGAVIVSGMANGIDGICHRGALDAGGFTIAVLGCGIDKVYPPEHSELMNEIIQKGLVITEYRPLTPPYGENFPVRNRIISGLSQGALIVEADYKSGALITARTALYQGRDLFALPGKIGEQNSIGTNRLIQDGAKMITGAIDILDEYESLYPSKINMKNLPFGKSKLNKFVDKIKPKPKKPEISTDELVYKQKPESIQVHIVDLDVAEKILKVITDEPFTTDDIAKSSGFDISDVMMALTELEISGKIKSIPGGKFTKLI
jgi:DNA protecting protein DprA